MSMQSEEYVYVIGSPDSTIVKIGRSTDVAKRLSTIQRMSPLHLTVLWQTEGGSELETALHSWFSARRVHGEWFDFSDGDASALVAEAVSQITRPAVQPVSRVAIFSRGDVVRVTNGIWAFAETAVVRALHADGQYVVEENDGRTHTGHAIINEANLIAANSVPELPRTTRCTGVGCTCELFE